MTDRLAVHTEIRAALRASPELQRAVSSFVPARESRQGQVVALYHAGWRQGMSVEYAVRSLASRGMEEAEVEKWRGIEAIREHLVSTGDDAIWYGEDVDDLASRLWFAGWRPGMSAEEAKRRLAGLDYEAAFMKWAAAQMTREVTHGE